MNPHPPSTVRGNSHTRRRIYIPRNDPLAAARAALGEPNESNDHTFNLNQCLVEDHPNVILLPPPHQDSPASTHRSIHAIPDIDSFANLVDPADIYDDALDYGVYGVWNKPFHQESSPRELPSSSSSSLSSPRDDSSSAPPLQPPLQPAPQPALQPAQRPAPQPVYLEDIKPIVEPPQENSWFNKLRNVFRKNSTQVTPAGGKRRKSKRNMRHCRKLRTKRARHSKRHKTRKH